MSQPFAAQSLYQSHVWPQVTIAYEPDHLLIRTPSVLSTVSSALWGGGFHQADHFVNWKVPLTYRAQDPMEMTRDQIVAWGYPQATTIGLQTAAKLTHAAIAEEAGDAFRIICCTTAGTGNAARAGRVSRTYSAYQCCTINTFVLIDGCMLPAAMVNALLTATEAKAAALQDEHLLTRDGHLATGTSSDSAVIAVSQTGFPEVHAFAGTATTIGDAVARLVYATVREAVSTQQLTIEEIARQYDR